MKKIVFGVLTLVGLQGIAFSQDTIEWEPQKNITGYFSLEGNYFKDLKNYDRDYGMSISEAGLLASYKPIEKLTIKSVFVYRPNYSIDQMLNEVNAEYKFADFLKVKIGRFLTPLSPMNTYYYAPVNNSATLPMVITDHEFFPLNLDALSVNGKIGDNLKIDYDVFAGGFRNALWLNNGALGFFGAESDYFKALSGTDTTSSSNASVNTALQVGAGGHIGFSFNDYITIGFGMLKTSEKISTTVNGVASTSSLKKSSYGINFKAKYSTIQLIAEYWQYKLDMGGMGGMTVIADSLSGGNPGGNPGGSSGGTSSTKATKTAFAELSNTFGKFTPYIRYEVYSPSSSNDKTGDLLRYTAGINYKPLFETTLKLEYMHYKCDLGDLNGIVGTIIFKF